MNTVEKMAKTVDEAVEEALKELGVTDRSEVDITVLDAGSKGFLFLSGKPARVMVVKRFNPEAIAKSFLREVFAAMGLSVEIDTSLKDDKELSINMKGNHMGILIGKRGQTLDSLQYLTNLVVNKGDAPFVSVTLDTENYRQRRRETLESLAVNLSKKVKQTRREIVLEPMSSYERRIIHSVLQNNRYVTTSSEGQDPFRYVVIKPKKYSE